MTIAGYTYADLVSEVLTFQFSETKYKALTERWLNQAQRQIAISSEIRTQQQSQNLTTSVADASYAVPSNFGRLIDLFNTETHELVTPMDIRDFDALPESSARPYAYTVRDTELFLYPTPDAAYGFTLRFWQLPADMVNPTDTPEIPVQYQQLLIAYAMWKAFLREDDFQAATAWEAIWEKGLLKMRGEVQGDMFDGPRQVQGTYSDGRVLSPNVWR